MCKPFVVSTCFHMISTGCGNFCWFPRVSTGFPQPVEIMCKPLVVFQLFQQDFHRLWKPLLVSTGFHRISTGCANPVETAFGFHGFPQDFYSMWKSCGNPVGFHWLQQSRLHNISTICGSALSPWTSSAASFSIPIVNVPWTAVIDLLHSVTVLLPLFGRAIAGNHRLVFLDALLFSGLGFVNLCTTQFAANVACLVPEFVDFLFCVLESCFVDSFLSHSNRRGHTCSHSHCSCHGCFSCHGDRVPGLSILLNSSDFRVASMAVCPIHK